MLEKGALGVVWTLLATLDALKVEVRGDVSVKIHGIILGLVLEGKGAEETTWDLNTGFTLKPRYPASPT